MGIVLLIIGILIIFFVWESRREKRVPSDPEQQKLIRMLEATGRDQYATGMQLIQFLAFRDWTPKEKINRLNQALAVTKCELPSQAFERISIIVKDLIGFLAEEKPPKEKSPSGPMSPTDREILDFEWRLSNIVVDLSKDHEAFVLLAAAIFVLHQDMKKAMKIDLRKTDEVIQGLEDDKLLKSLPGGLNFLERNAKAFEMITEIIHINEEFCVSNANNADAKTQIVMSSFRARAAQVWMLTLMAKTGKDNRMKLTSANIWMRLQIVDRTYLAQPAKEFTGTYFNGVSCDQFALNDWPLFTPFSE
jgi:hypothetical protein